MTNHTLAVRIATALVVGALLAGLLYFTPKLAPATAKTFVLVVQDDSLASGESVISVNQGDSVTLRIRSDRGGQIMIHGYEQELMGRGGELTVNDGGEIAVTFVADRSGRYMVHLHRADQHLEIAQIDVQPR